MNSTYPKVEKPSLTPLINPTLLSREGKESQFLKHLSPPVAPSITKLNPTFYKETPCTITPTKGARIIEHLKDIKQHLPSLWKIIIVVLLGLAIPLVLPAVGILPAIGLI